MKQAFAAKTDTALDIAMMRAEIERRLLRHSLDILDNPKSTNEDKSEAFRVLSRVDLKTVDAILDRGHGKPQQKLEVDNKTAFDDMTPEEFEEYVADRSAKVAEMMRARRGRK